ncbi:hypothetical protein L7F22_028503 [Adiantum nelumboides]|nr:hypothetical protein [Adiantum nelumboides]
MEPPYATLRERKLVVLGLPFDVETEELKYYMRTYGELDDCIVMKDRATGQSRGFGYVTFSTVEDAKKAVSSQHVLNGRSLDVKIATPKDEMVPSASKKVSRIFVARIPPHVTEGMFRSYFQKYGGIVDAYMPKDAGSRSHRGIGFVTFDNAESVDRIMNETHELGGTLVAVDRATPKDETLKGFGARQQYDQSGRQLSEQWTKALPDQWSKMPPEQFGFYMAAAAAAMAQMGALGGMGGSMEGLDLASYGFPGFTAPGIGGENASEGEAAKNAVTQVNDPASGGAEASQALPSPTTGYGTQGSAPQNTTAASGYETEAAAQNNPASGYGPAALFNSMYAMFSGYGANPATTGMPSAAYNNASHASGPNYSAGYGQSADYSTASVAPGYYNAPAGDATAQPYGYDNVLGAHASGYTYVGSGVSGQGYDGNVSYAAPEVANYGYGASASYAGVAPTSGAGYASNMYDQAAARYAPSNPNASTMGNKVFVGKLPHDATSEHLRTYFSSFGRIADVYVPKDPKKTGHRGFGFVTFFDDGVAEQVALQSHEIMGQPIAVDRPTPLDSAASNTLPGNFLSQPGLGDAGAWGNAAELQRSYDYTSGRLGFFAAGQPNNPHEGAPGADRVSRPSDFRYRPY